MKIRDHNDAHRAFAPLKAAANAIILDTSHLNIKQVLEAMITYIEDSLIWASHVTQS